MTEKPNPMFFFSYARADRDNSGTDLNAQDGGQTVDKFYRHLCAEVAELTARPAGEVGFFDRQNLELGMRWPKHLMDALRSAHVMVALFSPFYFSRPACGREFEIFRRRHEALNKSLDRTTDYRILPVFWVRPDVTRESIKTVPSPCRRYIADLQFADPRIPECYIKYGLKRMSELEMNIHLNSVCHCIADRIYELIKGDSLPDLNDIDFHTVKSAFHEAATDTPRLIDRRKREIRVYYLIPTRTEWSRANDNEDFEEGSLEEFGDRPEKARPFGEEPGTTVGRATEDGVGMVKPDLAVVHEQLPNDFAGSLADAVGTLTTPLVVFDRRALRLPHLRTAAVSYAQRNFENTGFITVAGREVPDAEVDRVCGAKIGALPKLHNWSVPAGRRAYVDNVASVVHELEAQLVRRQSDKLAPSGEVIPGLSGPSKI
jgi:TIR domain